MTTTNFVQLPPDGVGKKIRHREIVDVLINTVTLTPPVGTKVKTAGGATGYLAGVYSAEDVTWYLSEVTGTFAANTTILRDSDDAVLATISTTITPKVVNTPVLNISDSATPEYTLTVDKRGAALTSFPEGTPQFDAWGRQQLSQLQAVAEYYFFTQDLAGKFYTTSNGASSSVKHNVANSAVVFTTGIGATDSTKRVSNQYHPYKPGVSQLIYMSVGIGDTGKSNVVREWGYFDDFNGFGFRLDGTTLKVFKRSDQTGTPVDTEITQANWNINTLDNAISSDFLLNVNAPNIYWMDIQAQIGRIRLGVETPDGRRITCHEFRQVNGSLGLGLRNASLPITWAQRNTGVVSSSPAATQYMLTYGGVVFTESADILYTGVLTHISPDDPVELSDSTIYKPFLSFKAKNTIDGPSQTINIDPLVVGYKYTVEALGTTDFNAAAGTTGVTYNVGSKFTAANTGNGTGVVHANMPNSIIGIHETFDWASEGNSNIHVGIFVLPSEKWLTSYNWSSTIQPQTMLYVDQTSTAMAQYQYWSTKAIGISGSISGNTLTVSAVTGTLLKEMYLTAPPAFADGPLSAGFNSVTGAVTNRTKIIRQLTSTTQTVSGVALGTQSGGSGVVGSNRIVMASVSGIVVDHIVAGTSVPAGTVVEAIEGTTLVLSAALTGSASGTYNFAVPGYAGTYQVDKSQTVASLSGFGAYYSVKPIESFMASANSSGRAALGDRIEKSFGLGGNPNPAEDAKPVFVFAAKPTKSATTTNLMYTKYWKEIR